MYIGGNRICPVIANNWAPIAENKIIWQPPKNNTKVKEQEVNINEKKGESILKLKSPLKQYIRKAVVHTERKNTLLERKEVTPTYSILEQEVETEQTQDDICT